MNTSDLISTASLRPDGDILSDIWGEIWQIAEMRTSDTSSLSITVHNGVVTLEGHMSGSFNCWRVENTARAVPGVVAVHNQVVVDRDLDNAVAQALAGDASTRPFVLPVGSHHGWVRLGGSVPNREVQMAVEAVAAGVPTVRGIITLPRVAGQPSPARRAIQPRIGADVYAEDGQAGAVVQVIINPLSRLVSHMIVNASSLVDQNHVIGFTPVRGDYLVPVDAAKVVNDQSVILASQPASIRAYPLFDAAKFPPASSNWRAPYPYKASAVRWFPSTAAEAAHMAEPRLVVARPAAASPAEINLTQLSNAKKRQQGAPQPA